MKKSIPDLSFIMNVLKKSYDENISPSVTLIANTTKSPFNILVSTIISLRTKDQVTLEVSNRLFQKIKNLQDLEKVSLEELTSLLYPAGFYKTKAIRLKEIARILLTENSGVIPDEIDALLKLPGVGRKTANLVVILGYNKPGICVDTHVHRISNRLGWVKTKKPEDTEFALREILPQEHWRVINDYLVSYGQMVCRPVSPLCSNCGLKTICPKVGVDKSR